MICNIVLLPLFWVEVLAAECYFNIYSGSKWNYSMEQADTNNITICMSTSKARVWYLLQRRLTTIISCNLSSGDRQSVSNG